VNAEKLASDFHYISNFLKVNLGHTPSSYPICGEYGFHNLKYQHSSNVRYGMIRVSE
jgi:hypothetical protein